MHKKQLIFLFVSCLLSLSVWAQKKAVVSGRILDAASQPIPSVSITLVGINGGTISDKNGNYHLAVPANKNIEIAITHISYQTQVRSILLKPGDSLRLFFTLKPSSVNLKEIEVEEEKN